MGSRGIVAQVSSVLGKMAWCGRHVARSLEEGSRRTGSLSLWVNEVDVPRSPPARGRGSKQAGLGDARLARGRPPHGGVDRNHQLGGLPRSVRRRPPHGGVDRNLTASRAVNGSGASPPARGRGSKLLAGGGGLCRPRRPPHGGVDRNTQASNTSSARDGRPPHGGVDRNANLPANTRVPGLSPLARGRGSKQTG